MIKRKGDKLYVKWKGYDNSFNSWIDKKRPCIKTSQYFPKPFRSLAGTINVKVDVDKLVLVPVDLSKLNDVVKNYVVKKAVYNK